MQCNICFVNGGELGITYGIRNVKDYTGNMYGIMKKKCSLSKTGKTE
jgi:hypothetical protein